MERLAACRMMSFPVLVFVSVTLCWGHSLTRAGAALRLADDLKIPHNGDEKQLYGLFPAIFPGGYDGTLDLSYSDKTATLETVVVAIVRWAGWDTVHYDQATAEQVTQFVTPEGFPFYQPDPTPRSIPYIVVALSRGLIAKTDLPRLRQPVTLELIDKLAASAKALRETEPVTLPLVLDAAGMKSVATAKPNPGQLLIVPRGFSDYSELAGLPNRILDFNASSLRLFNETSQFADGKQEYFPLGPLDSQLSVGLGVPASSYSHQSEAIRGDVSNWSQTVNAVGVWASARSMRKNARIWGEFVSAASAEGPERDAQVIGLEVDVINSSLRGKAPNRTKTGIQVVGIGSSANTNAFEVIGAGPAKWVNGLLFESGSLEGSGSVIGLAGDNALDYGIDFSGTKFRGSAFLLHQGSSVDFGNISGNRSRLYTDAFGNGHLALQAGVDGFRVTSNDDSKNLLSVNASGDVETPQGKLSVRVSVPAKSTSPGENGMWAADDSYLYVCVGKGVWKRSALASW